MYAEMVKDEYIDIYLGFKYKVSRVYSKTHFSIEGCPRRYLMNCFVFYDDNGNKISQNEAYEIDREKRQEEKNKKHYY